MKICLINNLYHPLDRGGAEKIVAAMADSLRRSGNDVFVIATKPKKITVSEIEEDVYRINSGYLNLVRYPKVFRLFWHLWDWFDFITARLIGKILKKECPDLVITHNLTGISFLVPAILRRRKIRHFHMLHDIQLLHPSGLMFYGREREINSFFAGLYQNFCRRFFSSPEKVISPSRWLMDFHLEKRFFPRSERIVIPNPMPEIEIGNNRSEKDGATIFLYAGQIEEHKGVPFLLGTFFQLIQHNQESKMILIIAGTGSLLDELKKKYERDGIVFLGKVPREKMPDLLSKTSCLIAPSICYENSPGIIYEALSVGLPVIASEIGGIPELIANKNFLLRPLDAGDLKTKMKWIAANQAEAFRLAGENGELLRAKTAGYGKKISEML